MEDIITILTLVLFADFLHRHYQKYQIIRAANIAHAQRHIEYDEWGDEIPQNR